MWIIDVYEDEGGHWRWRMKAENGQTVAASGESFDSMRNAQRASREVISGIREGRTVVARMRADAEVRLGGAATPDQPWYNPDCVGCQVGTLDPNHHNHPPFQDETR